MPDDTPMVWYEYTEECMPWTPRAVRGPGEDAYTVTQRILIPLALETAEHDTIMNWYEDHGDMSWPLSERRPDALDT